MLEHIKRWFSLSARRPNSAGDPEHSKELSMERGNIESGLVLVPTTLFFLMTLQILLAGSWQTIERTRLHDMVIESSIKDSLGNSSNRDFERDSKYLDGISTDQLSEESLGSTSSLSIRHHHTPVGTIETFELKTDLPILGNFFNAFGSGLFQVKNYAVSMIS